MLEENDVSADSSSEEVEQTQPESSEPSTEAPAAAETAPKTEDNVPFHMHPRFQEVISEKNALKEQFQAQAKILEQLQNQMKASTPAEKDELMERLESIDPKFASMMKSMKDELRASKQALEELSGWRQQSSAQSVQQQIQSTKSQFYAENKIPEDRRAIYEALVQTEASKNPRLQISDLPQVMKQVHDTLGKMFQTVERDTTKKFVAGKQGEAAKPATMKPGAPAKAVKQDNAPISRADLMAQMKAEVLKSARDENDI